MQAGITVSLPFLATLAKNYGRHRAAPMRTVAQMWVDDTMMAFRADQGPQAQSALLDQQVYFMGILGIDIASRKVQWAGPDGTPIRLAKEEAVRARKGWKCAEDPVGEDSPIWDGATEIPLTNELSYLGTDIGTETPARCL